MPFDAMPVVELSPAQRVLLEAARLVRKGHCKGRYDDGAGRYCALGAIRHAARGDSNVRYAAKLRLAAVLGRDLNIGDWNDAPGMTGERVACGLERAAL